MIGRRSKLTFAFGEPVTTALEYPTGRRVQSRIPGAPDQMYYSLSEGREAYLPLELGRMIEELRLTVGEPFTICKYGPGNWKVERSTPPEPDPQPLPPIQPATKLEHALKTAILAASRAEKYGTELGYTVRFDSEAIKAMAITVLINMEGRA